jgi:hypothetical protein
MPYPMGGTAEFTTAPYMVAGYLSALVSARAGDDPKTGEQQKDRSSEKQRTDYRQDLLEEAEAAAIAQPTQP